MTIAISLKINDGLVLAADSASTVMAMVPGQQMANVLNVYNNANKIFNLYKGLPIGAITWGGGAIGAASIATIVKDLRDRFSGKNPPNLSWVIQKTDYTIEQVAKQFRSRFPPLGCARGGRGPVGVRFRGKSRSCDGRD